MPRTPNKLALEPLVVILSRVDALFLPFRPNRPSPERAVAYELQQAYRRQGIRFSGSSADARKDAQEVRDALAAAGFIRLRQIRSDRTISVQLTAKGEALARASCELPPLAAAIAGMDRLWELRDNADAADHAGFRWLPENLLAGTPAGDVGDEARLLFAVVEQIMLPALMRGWALANSDNAGHAWYALSPKFQRTPSDSIKPRPAIATPRPSATLRQLYASELRQELSRLESVPVEGQSIGMIPMPASPITRGQAKAIKLEAQNV